MADNSRRVGPKPPWIAYVGNIAFGADEGSMADFLHSCNIDEFFGRELKVDVPESDQLDKVAGRFQKRYTRNVPENDGQQNRNRNPQFQPRGPPPQAFHPNVNYQQRGWPQNAGYNCHYNTMPPYYFPEYPPHPGYYPPPPPRGYIQDAVGYGPRMGRPRRPYRGRGDEYAAAEREVQKERKKLELKPRTKPIEEEDRETEESSDRVRIFGGAKPVDTAQKEKEVEERIQKEREELHKKIEEEQAEKLGRTSRRTLSSESGRISTTEANRAILHFSALCSSPIAQEKLKNFNSSESRLDDLYFGLLSEDQESKDVWKCVKILLLLSHGNASVEGGFSVNESLLVENLAKTSIMGQRTVLDAIQAAGGSCKIVVDKSMISRVRCAKSQYSDYLKKQKEDKDREEREKGGQRKRRMEKLKELEAKKQRLAEEQKLAEAEILAEKKALLHTK